MKFLTSLYRQALHKDFKASNTQANAYNVQQVLYENHRVFGNLYRFENFRNVFAIPPISSEFLDFLSFWKGVELVLDGKYKVVNLSMPDLLHKSCYVDDQYVVSLRFFRDEILKSDKIMTKSELLEAINKAQKNSDLTDFWPKVLENTRRIFKSDNVSVLNISNMVFTFLDSKYSGEAYLMSELESITTEHSGEEDLNGDSKSLATESPLEYQGTFDDPKVEFKLDDSEESWSYEYKYRKLLFDLENSLPKFYTYYSDTKAELSQSREEVKRLMETNDSLTNQFSREKMDLVDKNSHLEEELRLTSEKNSSLNQLLVSKDTEIEELTRRVDEVNDMWKSSDLHRLSEELQAYMGKCDGLQKTNDGLKTTISELEGAVLSAREEVERTSRDRESMQSLLTERETLMEMLETNDLQYSRLLGEINELAKKNESLKAELLECKNEVLKYEEEVKKGKDENVNLTNEIEALKGENESLKQECSKLNEEREKLVKEVEELKEKINQLEELNKQLEQELGEIETYKEKVEEMEGQIEELSSQNEQLKGKIGDVIHDNINLVAKLEMVNSTSPKQATNRLMDMIEKYKDVQTPLSMESDTTDYDVSDRSEPSTADNRVKIVPELAETRKLNTMNAIKFGVLNSNTPRPPLNAQPELKNRMIYRKTSSFPRTFSVKDDSLETSYNESLSMSNYEELGISDVEETPDMFQNAISFLSKKLKLK